MSVPSIVTGILITLLVIILVIALINLLPVERRLKQILRVIVIALGLASLVRFFGVDF